MLLHHSCPRQCAAFIRTRLPVDAEVGRCETRGGCGSSWEDAAFFDFDRGSEQLAAIAIMHHAYTPRHD